MGFERLNFTKEWTDHGAFPTVETDEAKVRADMQALHDEAKAGLNKLMDALEAAESAAKLGAVGPQGENSTVQQELDGLHAGMLKAGALPVGGSTNQMLIKSSDENYATRWGGAADIGAAASEHKHSANDVASGILAVARGGTGVETLEELYTALGAPRIATGSYVGTGTSGASNPNSLTFDFVPKLLVLIDNKYNLSVTIPYVSAALSAFNADTPIIGIHSVIGWGTNTLSWYSNGSTPKLQFNESGVVCYYAAIG